MKKENNDIKKLFLSFGADADNFKELTRAADASQAESRWPLLSSVQPGKRELPPLLSREEKSHSWHAPAQHAQGAATQHATAGLGEKLAGSLKQQLQARQQPQVKPHQSVAAAAVMPSAHAEPSSTVQAAPPASKNLFSFAVGKEVPSRVAIPADALSGVFQRIAQPAPAPQSAGTVLRKGLFGRLGRS